jgi:hypothetical protein
MTVAQEIHNLQDLVYELLLKDARLRDSDRKLSARVWTIQLGGLEKMKTMTAYDFLCLYTEERKLFSQESIGRARRLIQESNVELRGKNYKERQDEQNSVKDVIRNSAIPNTDNDSAGEDEHIEDNDSDEKLSNQTE